MSDQNQKNWSEYYNKTRNKPPRPLLVEALKHVSRKGAAIDIGAGALNDTRFLLSQGFEVDSLDKSSLIEQEASDIKSDMLHIFTCGFEDFNFISGKYDIASAMYALPFIDPKYFDPVFLKIKSSLNSDGVFCGQFFGLNDSWSSDTKMTFHSKEQIENILTDMDIISLTEEEKDGPTAKGDIKHWHVFHVIAKKR